MTAFNRCRLAADSRATTLGPGLVGVAGGNVPFLRSVFPPLRRLPKTPARSHAYRRDLRVGPASNHRQSQLRKMAEEMTFLDYDPGEHSLSFGALLASGNRLTWPHFVVPSCLVAEGAEVNRSRFGSIPSLGVLLSGTSGVPKTDWADPSGRRLGLHPGRFHVPCRDRWGGRLNRSKWLSPVFGKKLAGPARRPPPGTEVEFISRGGVRVALSGW